MFMLKLRPLGRRKVKNTIWGFSHDRFKVNAKAKLFLHIFHALKDVVKSIKS